MKPIYRSGAELGRRCATIVAIGAASIACAIVPALAQRGGATISSTVVGPAVDASKLDVAGVSLGMSPQRAAAAAAAASYRCQVIASEDSFEEAVGVAVLERRGGAANPFRERHGVRTLRCEGPSGARMDVDFGQAPGGGMVRQVVFATDPGRVDEASVLQRALAKYGTRSLAHGDWSAWCRPEAARYALNRQCDVGAPSLTLGGLGGQRLILTEAEPKTAAREAAVKAEAARRAPASTHPAF